MNAAQHILVFGVRVYRWVISPAKTFLFGPLSQCRFTPTCSAYAAEAIASHGALLGSGLALKRICRCHPWGGCGDDPVPPSSLERPRPWARRPGKQEPSAQWDRTPKPMVSSFAPGAEACRSGR